MLGICSTYESCGGAAKAADRLFTALVKDGVPATYFVKNRQSDRTNVLKLGPFSRASDSLSGLALMRYAALARCVDPEKEAELHRKISARYPVGVFTSDIGPCGVADLEVASTRPKLWNLHWIAEFFNQAEVLPWMATVGPIVWTLHDKAPFSPGWHYSQPASRIPIILSYYVARIRKRKKATMAMIHPERMTIVSPSKWLARESERSELFGSYRHEVIPYGLSTTTFAPLDREQQRKKLGLSKEEFVFGCVSQVLQDPRKNYQTMIEALESISGLHRRQIVLLSVGEGAWKSQTIKCINLGTLSDEARMAEVYSAMDCFVCPSLEDNLPNTILEAMACGCPAAAFDAGGIADLVRSNVTGWLVTEKSKEGLATALLCAMNQTEEQRRSLSSSCRGTALREYAQEVQARKYQKLFEDILAGAGTTQQGEAGHS